MKLKVPIQKKNCPVKYADTREFRNGLEHGRDEVLDEISQLEVFLDADKMANILWKMSYCERDMEFYIKQAKAIIASLPEIMSVRKGKE